jgi:TonB family protein
VATATLTWEEAREGLAGRQALSLGVSVALHATFAIAMFTLATREIPPPPIEISIFDTGPRGPASPPPGKPSAEPGPVGPPVEAAAPSGPKTAPVERPAPKAKSKAPAKKAPSVQAPPAPRAVENMGVLGALRKAGPAAPSSTRAFEGLDSNVALRARPSNVDAAGPAAGLGSARAKANVAVDAEGVASGGGPAVSGSLGTGVGSVVLPGPGGGGSGWGGGGDGNGGGGTGRGGFSVSGAGSGGTGRSYNSIWQQTQRYLAGLRWAYNNELRNNPALRGVMVVRYEILPSGSVGAVTLISSALKDARLEQQVLSQIRGWKYQPEPSGAVQVTWPFSFLPPG